MNNENTTETREVDYRLLELNQKLLKASRIAKDQSPAEIKDLCSNCDHKFNCSLRGSSHFILQCEHYQ